MGGDHGPHVTVPAALEFQARLPDVDIVLVGLRDALEAELAARRAAAGPRLRVRHASEVVAMDEPPVQALRYKKDSSMRVAVNLVKNGEAHACVNAGNTGALMAISRFVLKTLPGIDRPAIASVLPNMRRTNTYVLDLGANVDCTPENLLQFGIMGAMLVSAVEHKERPSVGLLNIGVEDIKGNETVKRAADLLRSSGLNFAGNVEGDDIYKGGVDVVVCDGFVGNVALKARSEEHTSELQSPCNLVCRLLLEKKKRTRSSRQQARLHSINVSGDETLHADPSVAASCPLPKTQVSGVDWTEFSATRWCPSSRLR